MLFTKINIGGIVKDHLNTLVHEHSGKSSASDYLLFYGVPLIAAFGLVWFKGIFGKSIGGVLDHLILRFRCAALEFAPSHL